MKAVAALILIFPILCKITSGVIYTIDTDQDFEDHCIFEYVQVVKYYKSEEAMIGVRNVTGAEPRGIHVFQSVDPDSSLHFRFYIANLFNPGVDVAKQVLFRYKSSVRVYVAQAGEPIDVTTPVDGSIINWQSHIYPFTSNPGSVRLNIISQPWPCISVY
jgi:hypothetical protein